MESVLDYGGVRGRSRRPRRS